MERHGKKRHGALPISHVDDLAGCFMAAAMFLALDRPHEAREACEEGRDRCKLLLIGLAAA